MITPGRIAANSEMTGRLSRPVDTEAAVRPIRVAAVYPAFDPKFNEWPQVWAKLAEDGAVECRIIAGSKDSLKGAVASDIVTQMPGIEIRRISGALSARRCGIDLLDAGMVSWIREFDPDVVISECDFLVRIGRHLCQGTRATHVLLTERWFDSRRLRRREYFGVPVLRDAVNAMKRRMFGKFVDRFMINDPLEIPRLRAAAQPERYDYVPWPHPKPREWEPPRDFHERSRDKLLYIGSMSYWKGAANLERYLSTLLAREPAARVKVVGPAIDRVSRNALSKLAKWGARCEIVGSMPRADALREIATALCVFCPSDFMGWGLIGDAWNMSTPVIGVGEFYELKNERNALIARSADELPPLFNRLRNDPVLWRSLAASGHECVQTMHSTEVVSHALHESLKRSLRPEGPPDCTGDDRLAEHA